ncbi:MAG: HAD family hydrolase [Candidatus Hodarchaeales archaeon]|jgi:FMN phosphatase YigB (HAD superfamily)
MVKYYNTFRLKNVRNYKEEIEKIWIHWLKSMFTTVGVSPPPEKKILEIVYASLEFICQNVRSTYPGAGETIKQLSNLDLELFTSSGETFHEISNYLKGLEVDHLFNRLYGPDLANISKENPNFYQVLFDLENLNPEHVMVVDDNFEMIKLAISKGATGVLVNSSPHKNLGENFYQIESLKQILPIVKKLV